jgi:serine/threonine protein kinase
MSTLTIGRYEIANELGQGGMAGVFLARDPYMHRQVAIKVLSYQLTADEMVRDYFQREAEAIAALEHPCIVPVFDFGWHGQQPYIVMRYMAGGSLEDRLQQAELPLRELDEVISRVADGLDAAHKRGIIHRDVKPSNILYDSEGLPHLSDFGLAKFLDRPTEEGVMLIGTPEYMSPEQVRDESLDGRSDVYALGVVLYQALGGQVPFAAQSSMQTARAHLVEPVPQILTIRPDLNAAWGEIISKAMAKAPGDRYTSAGELAAEVSDVAAGRWYFRKII